MSSAVLVQTKTLENNVNPSSVALTFTSTTKQGNFIFVGATTDTASTTAVSAISDNFGNVYTKIAGTIAGTGSIHRWYAKNIVGGASHAVTLTLTGTPDINVIVAEYSGVDRGSPLDVSAVATGSSTAVSSGATLVTAFRNSLVIGLGGDTNGSGATITVGAGFGDFIQLTTTVSFFNLYFEDKFITSPAAQTATFTEGAAPTTSGCSVDVFKVANAAKFKNSGLRPHPFSPGLAR